MEKATKSFTSLFEDKKQELIGSIQENMPKERIDIEEWLTTKPKLYVHKVVNQEDLFGERSLLMEMSFTKTGIRNLTPLTQLDMDTIGMLCILIDEKLNND